MGSRGSLLPSTTKELEPGAGVSTEPRWQDPSRMGPISSWGHQHRRGEAAALQKQHTRCLQGFAIPAGDTLPGGGLSSHTAPSIILTIAVPSGFLLPGIVPQRSTAQPLLRQVSMPKPATGTVTPWAA